MRSRLLSTTALFGLAALLPIAPALGQEAAKPIELHIGGTFDAFFALANEDSGTGEPGFQRRSHGVQRRGFITFAGDTVLDNGLVAGVNVEFSAETCPDQIDQSFIFFESRYGRAEIGSTDSAAKKMWIGAPNPVAGHGINSPSIFTVQRGSNRALPSTFIGLGPNGKEEKIAYFTPRVGGFEFGLSYAPDGCKESNVASGAIPFACGGSFAGLPAKNNAGQHSKLVEGAINYIGTYGDTDIAAYVGYGHGTLEAQSGFLGRLKDNWQFGMGGSVSYAGYTFGGGMRHTVSGFVNGPDSTFIDGAAATEQRDYNFGITYQTGPWVVGGQYHRTRTDLTIVAPADEGTDALDGLSLGGTYLLGPGIVLTAGLEYWSYRGSDKSPATLGNDSKNQAVVLLFGTRLNF